MELHEALYPILFIVFGGMECLTNIFYLVKKNGLALAAKQHFELPPGASVRQLRVKVFCMLIFGSLFLLTGFCKLTLVTASPSILLLPLTAFTLYTLVEACYYKRVGAFIMTGLSTALLLLFLQSIR